MIVPGDGRKRAQTAERVSEREDFIASLRPWLRAALACDALDTLGLRNQCLDPGVKPLRTGAHLIGFVKTLLIAPTHETKNEPAQGAEDDSYSGLLQALERVEPGDVFVSASTEESRDAVWGELMATACLAQGATGAVCDGYARDLAALETLPFPIFSRGTIAYDSKGRSKVIASHVSVAISGVVISPDDLLVADDDGVVIVPKPHIEDVIREAREKAETEEAFRRDIRMGLPLSQAVAKYRIL